MTKHIELSNPTYCALADLAILPFKSTGRQDPATGNWSVPIQDDTFARLERMRRPEETHEQVVRRVIGLRAN